MAGADTTNTGATDAAKANGNGHGKPVVLRESMQAQRVPGWIAERLGLPAREVATLTVPNDGIRSPYQRYLMFLARHGKEVTCAPDGDGRRRVVNTRILNKFQSDKPDSYWSGFRRTVKEKLRYDADFSAKPVYFMGEGEAVVKFKDHEVYVVHEVTGPTVGLQDFGHTPRVIRLYAKDNALLDSLTRAMIKFTNPPPPPPKTKGKYRLFTLEVECGRGMWSTHGMKDSRTMESVILPDGMLESIVEDFKDFTADETKRWYTEHGLPYRRSYLFHGPPGVGKTSSIRALAGCFNLAACFISLGNAQIGNKQLHQGLRSVPKPCILVLEDIDALFNEKRQAESPMALTFSGLLNALDGLVAAEGVVSVMTTNHIERLDPALIRAGRVDRRFEFTAPDHAQIMNLFANYYPDSDAALQREFADKVFDRREKEARSIATLQEHFIFSRKKNPRECIDMLPTFFAEFYPKASQRNQTYFS